MKIDRERLDHMEQAMFAGGCFWCMVTPFEELPGIHGIVSGYAGGITENPTYEEVKTGTTGHYEVVQITFDPALFHTRSCLNYIGLRLTLPMMVGNFRIEELSTGQRSSIIMKNSV